MTSNYHLPISLQHICLVKISSLLWGKIDFSPINFDVKTLNSDIITVINEANQILPPKLQFDLASVTTSMGFILYKWRKYLNIKLQLKESKAFRVYWTSVGVLDKVNILKEISLYIFDDILIYQLACEYCNEELIMIYYQKVKTELMNSMKTYLMVYWSCYSDKDWSNFEYQLQTYVIYRCGNCYKARNSINLNMFKLSVSEGCELACTYFWNKLSEEEKLEIKLSSIKLSLKRYELERIMPENYLNFPGFNHIFIFLLKTLNEKDSIELFKEKKDIIIKLFLDSWPYQNLIFICLNDMWSYFTQFDFNNLIFKITERLLNDYELFKTVDLSKYQKIFYDVWNRCPVKLKNSMDKQELTRVIKNLMYVKDIYNLQCVIQSIESNTSVSLKYIIDIFSPNLLLYLIKYDFNFFEQFVYHECNKKSINLMKEKLKRSSCDILYFLIDQGCLKEADKYVNWQFPNDQEKKEAKLTFLNSHYFIKLVYKLSANFKVLISMISWVSEDLKELEVIKNEFLMSENGVNYVLHFILSKCINDKSNYEASLLEFIQYWFTKSLDKGVFILKLEDLYLKRIEHLKNVDTLATEKVNVGLFIDLVNK